MKNTRRFFLGSNPEDPSGVTSIRLTYNSIDVTRWLNNNPSAISAYRAQLRKRLNKFFPDAKILLKGIPTANGNTWMIRSGNNADEVSALMQCEDILDRVINCKNDWLPRKGD